MRAGIIRISREHFYDSGVNDKCHTQEKTPVDLKRPPSDRVDGKDTHCGSSEGNDSIDSLE